MSCTSAVFFDWKNPKFRSIFTLKFARTNVFGSFIHYWNAAVVQHGKCLGQEARKLLCLIKIAVGIDWQSIFTLKMGLYRKTLGNPDWCFGTVIQYKCKELLVVRLGNAPGLNFPAIFCKLPQIYVGHGFFSLQTALCSPSVPPWRRLSPVPPLTPFLQQLLLRIATALLWEGLGKTEGSGSVPLLHFHNAYLMS